MESKERVKLAVQRKRPDRVPMGFYLVDHDIISAVIGHPTFVRNSPAFMIALWEGRRDEAVESMKSDIVDFYRKIDCVDLITWKESRIVPPKGDMITWQQPLFIPSQEYLRVDKPKKVDDTTWADTRGNVYKIVFETNTVTQVAFADGLTDKVFTEDDFSERLLPEKPDKSIFEPLDYLISDLGESRYIAGYTSGITALTLLGDMEEGMMNLALHPEIIHACNRQKVFYQNHMDEFYIRPGVDGVLMEQDFGGTKGPLISPAMFKELCYPYMKQRVQRVKELVPQVLFHCCGSIVPLLDMMIDTGIDALESIQTNAAGMALSNLVKNYGDRLCLWGNLSLESLTIGSTEDVRREVRRCLEEGKKSPGYVFGPSHSIAFGTKYDNFMAMLDEFVKYREY
jgi:hypothetical protein